MKGWSFAGCVSAHRGSGTDKEKCRGVSVIKMVVAAIAAGGGGSGECAHVVINI